MPFPSKERISSEIILSYDLDARVKLLSLMRTSLSGSKMPEISQKELFEFLDVVVDPENFDLRVGIEYVSTYLNGKPASYRSSSSTFDDYIFQLQQQMVKFEKVDQKQLHELMLIKGKYKNFKLGDFNINMILLKSAQDGKLLDTILKEEFSNVKRYDESMTNVFDYLNLATKLKIDINPKTMQTIKVLIADKKYDRFRE